jgi:dihydroneopterin aldolase
MTYPYAIADATRKLRHVFVRDLLLAAAIGVWRHEQDRRQRLRVNLDLAVREWETVSDTLEDVVCYQEVVDRVKAIVAASRVKLVETLAEHIAAACLEDSRVWSARVRVEKLDAIPEAVSVGVEIERHRRSQTP